MKAFLADRGLTLEDSRPVQASYWPGRSCVVRYRVVADGPRGHRGLAMCVETRERVRAPRPPSPGIEEAAGLAEPVGQQGGFLVWSFPYDPSLAELPDAASGISVRRILSGAGDPPAAVSVQALRYRPRRRAVFRYRMLRHRRGERRWETAFGKVLPRRKAESARLASSALDGGAQAVGLALPTGTLGRQTFLFQPLAGRSLRDLLLLGGPLPSPARVAGLPEAVAAAVDGSGAELPGPRRAPLEIAEPTAELLQRLVPTAEDDIRRVVDAVTEGTAREGPPIRPIHGDLYEAQVFVNGDFSLSLLDLDDLGPGDPAADAANFCAHLLALALSAPAIAHRLVAYRALVRSEFLRRLAISPRDLAWREALAMLLLATGPFRVLDPAWPREVGRRTRLAVRLLED